MRLSPVLWLLTDCSGSTQPAPSPSSKPLFEPKYCISLPFADLISLVAKRIELYYLDFLLEIHLSFWIMFGE